MKSRLEIMILKKKRVSRRLLGCRKTQKWGWNWATGFKSRSTERVPEIRASDSLHLEGRPTVPSGPMDRNSWEIYFKSLRQANFYPWREKYWIKPLHGHLLRLSPRLSYNIWCIRGHFPSAPASTSSLLLWSNSFKIFITPSSTSQENSLYHNLYQICFAAINTCQGHASIK